MCKSGIGGSDRRRRRNRKCEEREEKLVKAVSAPLSDGYESVPTRYGQRGGDGLWRSVTGLRYLGQRRGLLGFAVEAAEPALIVRGEGSRFL